MTKWSLEEKNNIYLTISKNIRYYRKMKGITQKKLSQMTGYSLSYIKKIEAPNCQATFSIETIYNISLALNEDIKHFFEI